MCPDRMRYVYFMYVVFVFFFSSRRRHTRCALVTGVQTCALPIFRRRIAEITAGDPVRSARPVATLATTALGGMAEIGAVYLPDPPIARFALRRRQAAQRSSSLRGITPSPARDGPI